MQGRAGIGMQPRLGGGTRLMLAFEHRISDDIDLFIRDPQWIGYLSPRLNDRFDSVITGYEESSSALKIRCQGGEIDFIEVLAKKLFYRGWALTPRDLFDWRTVAEQSNPGHTAKIIGPLLRGDRLDALIGALDALSTSRSASAVWEAIRAPDKPTLSESVTWALEQTRHYAHSAEPRIERRKQDKDIGR